MAERALIEMQRRLTAGREYLTALRKLGFDPDVMAWAGAGEADPGHEGAGRFELLLVTTWADNIGPKAVYDLLFEAYDASATPKEIDPFIVTLFSPQTRVAADLLGAIRTARSPRLPPGGQPIMILGMLDYFTTTDWIIVGREPRSTRFEDARRFGAFQRNVQKLAA